MFPKSIKLGLFAAALGAAVTLREYRSPAAKSRRREKELFRLLHAAAMVSRTESELREEEILLRNLHRLHVATMANGAEGESVPYEWEEKLIRSTRLLHAATMHGRAEEEKVPYDKWLEDKRPEIEAMSARLAVAQVVMRSCTTTEI